MGWTTDKTTVVGVGPWLVCNDAEVVCAVRSEERANLIVSAPEMLQALKAFVDYYPSGVNPYLDKAYNDARAAIAKAEGGR